MVMRGAEQDYRPADLDRSVDAASENVDGPHVTSKPALELRWQADVDNGDYCPNGRQPHEWRQYMANPVGKDETDEFGYIEPFLEPDGFFCIHCTERKD